jgi:hypothetical protein
VTAWFVWAKGPNGPEPQLVFQHLQKSFDPRSKNSKALWTIELTQEHHERAKELRTGANGFKMTSVVDSYAVQFPKPEWPKYD